MTMQLENKGQYKEFMDVCLKQSEELFNFQSELINFISETDKVKENGKILVIPEGLTIKVYFKEYVDNLLICEIDMVDMTIKGFYMDKKYRNLYRKNLNEKLPQFESSKRHLEKKLKSKLMLNKKKEKLTLELQQTNLAIQHMKDYLDFFYHREETIVDLVWDIHEAINNVDLFPFFKLTRLYEHLDFSQ
jgi:hypothetical protein